MSATTLPLVSQCTIAGCSYNHDGCRASAITIAGTNGEASCATFIPLDVKGGLTKVVASVGACQRGECTHNDNLICAADSVRVGMGADHNADCLTYQPA